MYLTDEHQSNRLFRNRRNGFFREVVWTDDFIDNAVSQGVACSDVDRDGDMDLYVANWFAPDYFLINDGNGKFSRFNTDLTTLNDSTSSNSASFADVDNDGDMDLFVAGNNGQIYWYENRFELDSLNFSERTDFPFHYLEERVFGLLFEDFNQDGWLDCFITTRGINRLYLNNTAGNFREEFDSDYTTAYSTGSSAADLDSDGDLDLIVANKSDYSQVFLNPVNKRNSIYLKLNGSRSNKDAVGSKVFFYLKNDTMQTLVGYREVNNSAGYLSSKDPAIHFGFGKDSIISAEIIFPSGFTMTLENLNPGMYIVNEYGEILSQYYDFLNMLRFISSRQDFKFNLFLILGFIFWVSIYLLIGLRRYHWSSTSVAIQLLMLFLITFLSFVIFRMISTKIILISLLAFVLFGTVMSLIYSEHFLRLRKKREDILALFRNLADSIINIHDDNELISKIEETIAKHPLINKATFWLKNSTTLSSKHNNRKKTLQLSQSEDASLKNEKYVTLSADFLKSLSDQDFNIAIPVKRKAELFGLISLDIKQPWKQSNQEDLSQLVTLANQSAVAMENNRFIKETSRLVEQLTTSKVREQYVSQLEKTNRQLDEKNKELQKLFRELQEKESQLIHSEKMASLGQLVAGISHELNNPISFIYSNMSILSEYLDELDNRFADNALDKENSIKNLIKEMKDIISDSGRGSKAIKEIVQNLKSFSRLDQADSKDVKMSDLVDNCLKIVKHQIPDSIQVVVDIVDDPVLTVNPGQINQVIINLLSNAIQALNSQGKIEISNHIENDFSVLKITDDGPGIPEDIQSKIFDPFFTTKDVNKGTGLGLSISYSIIKKHNGLISVESYPGKGTAFEVRLPLSINKAKI